MTQLSHRLGAWQVYAKVTKIYFRLIICSQLALNTYIQANFNRLSRGTME